MRIQVVFNNTPILVPCGDGKLTVGELMQKAIVRFKKLGNKHPDDIIEVRSLRLADSGSFVDQDDEVADVLEDKETVLLDYEYIPHYAQDSRGGGAASISDESGITTTSQPFSPSNIREHHTPYADGNLSDPLGHTHSEGYATAESNVNDTHSSSQEENELASELHMTILEASQDTELVLQSWSSPRSQEDSPHLGRKTQQWGGGGTGRDAILGTQDSGYAPTKSQESYSHSQPKSQEIFSEEGPSEFSLPGHKEFSSTSNTSLTRQQGGRKDEEMGSGSHKGFDYDRSKPQDSFSRGHDARFGQRGIGREPGQKMVGVSPSRSMDFPHLRGIDIPGYRGQSDRYGYPGSYSETGDFRSYHPQSLEDGYDHRGRHQEWRRSYHGDFYHDPYGRYEYLEPPRMRGRFDRQFESLRGRYPPTHRDRVMAEEARMYRVRSHERMDTQHHYMGGGRWEDPNAPAESFLSQPNPSYFGYERQGFPLGPPPFMGYDGRQAMGGPAGYMYSLSQPDHMIYHGRMYGDYRMGYRGERGLRGRGKADTFSGRDRTYSIEEEFDRLDEEDELEEHMKGGAGGRDGISRHNPFQRNFRKSMFRDGPVFAQWMERVHEYGIEDSDANNEVPEFEGDASQSRSQSQRTPSPTPSGHQEEREKENGEEDSDEEDEFGNIHIVELHKGEEPLGIHLTHYTSPEGSDLGVFIGAMEESGFATKSGKLQVSDRILACNGFDFTKETNQRVEELFLEMSQQPLLRMAISRGLQLNLTELQGGGKGEGGEAERGREGERREGEERGAQEQPKASPSKTSIISPSTTLTNTRQIGVKHIIKLTKGSGGFGFGLTSRDVSTDDSSQPIYVKSITRGGAAFTDGRLKLGDRLLEVDGVGVTGMGRMEAVQLLRQAVGSVTVLISRQETVETQEEEFPQPSSVSCHQLTTVGKTVMTFEIPVYNSGPAGLGVTVYGRTSLNTSKRSGDMGIYIKSIVPGGAAAWDGRLCRTDQLLCINGQSLLGKSNQEALDTLRKALASATGEDAKVQVVIARRVGTKSSGFSSSMAALGEEPEEEEREADQGAERHEVGIDVPPETYPGSSHPQGRNTVVTATLVDQEPSRGSIRHHSTSDLRTQSHKTPPSTRTEIQVQQHGSYTTGMYKMTPSQRREREMYAESHAFRPSPKSSPAQRRNLQAETHTPGSFYQRLRAADALLQSGDQMRAADGLMGSGEFDRLEPLSTLEKSVDSHERSYHDVHVSPSSNLASDRFSWYDVERGRDYSSLDRKGMIRSTSQTSDVSTSYPGPPHMLSRHPPPPSHDIYSPTETDMMLAAYPYPRDGSLLRQQKETSPLGSRFPSYSPYSSDSASIASYSLSDHSSQVPTRGSGRRGKPERGGPSSYAAISSPPLTSDPDGFATMPRSVSRSSGRVSVARSATPTNPETSSLCSLEHLRLSDSEVPALRRDDIWRISITKKSKKNPRQDFAHLQFANPHPMMEGEKDTNAIVRTGSDSCLARNDDDNMEMLQGVELGPHLGMVKSSSLESLHNVMHHAIQRDSVSDLRNRETRNSFRRAVDHSYDDGKSQQRGVDVPFELEGRATVPAVISFTKSPMGMGKKQRKKGFLKRVFKKKKGGKKGDGEGSPQLSRRPRGASVDDVLDSSSFSEATPDDHDQDYWERKHSVSLPGEGHRVDHFQLHHRHSMPVIEDIDNDSNDDESLLSTMAKV